MVEKAGVHDPQLDTADLPQGFEHWYYRFMEMRRGERITFQDIYAYEQVMGIKLTPIEVSAILEMDRAMSEAIAEIIKETTGA